MSTRKKPPHDTDPQQRERMERIRRGDTRVRRDEPRNDRPRTDSQRAYGKPPREDRRDGRPFGGPRREDRRDGPPQGERRFDGPRRDERNFDRQPYGERRFDGPQRRERRFDGPPQGERRFDGPQRGERRFDGPPQGERRFDGPRRGRGPDADGNVYQQRSHGPPQGERRFDGPRRDERNFDGPQRGERREERRRVERPRNQTPAVHPARTTGRDVAAFAIMRVIYDGAFSNLALRSALREFPLERRDRAFATRLTYGTLTWHGYIDAVLNAMLPKGIASIPAEAACHLRVAMYQLLKDREHTPVHAAIDECVELVGAVEANLRGLTNGVLRNFERGREDILEKVAETHPVESKLSLSTEVAGELFRRVGETQAHAIMERWNDATPVVIRSRTGDREGLAALLQAEEGASATPHPLVPDALTFHGDIRTVVSHGNAVSVQDAGAQLVAYTLPPGLTGTVVDACAGFGGKTLHLLDQLPDADVVAADIDKRKLARIPDPDDEERLTRLPGDMSVYAGAEALALHAMQANIESGYDAVVIDAPCSALGTLGRHPEVRWRRTEDDVDSLSRIQRNLLKTLAPLVREGGYLVYIVCTFTEAETLTQVDRFLQTHPDFILSPPDKESADPRIDWPALLAADQTISLWPEPHQTDGFFIARFQKVAREAEDIMDEAEDEDEATDF